MKSCCGNVPSYWIDNKWSCSECGTVVYTQNEQEQLEFFDIIDKVNNGNTSGPKCTCGSSSVGSDRHSYYCELYKPNG